MKCCSWSRCHSDVKIKTLSATDTSDPWYQDQVTVLMDSPGTVPDDVPAIEGVNGDVLPHSVRPVSKDGRPAAEQHLVLKDREVSDRRPAAITTPHSNAPRSNLKVQDGEVVPVWATDDGVEVLKLGGQERSEGSLQTHGAGLLEAQEVGAADSSHVTGLRGVQGDEVKLWRRRRFVRRTPTADLTAVRQEKLPPCHPRDWRVKEKCL